MHVKFRISEDGLNRKRGIDMDLDDYKCTKCGRPSEMCSCGDDVGNCDSCDKKNVPVTYSRVCREHYCDSCFEYIAEKML